MKLDYFPETDTLYIELNEQPSVQSNELTDGIVVDYDAAGRVAGIEIEDASGRVQLDQLEVKHVPAPAGGR